MANTRELAQFASFVDFTGTSIGFSTQFNVSGVSTFTNTVIFDSTGSIQIPKGTTGQRLSGVLGQIRYNTSLSQFEGYGAGNAWGSLGGVKDVDGDTFIRAESAAGEDEDVLEFLTGNSTRLVIDSTGKVGIGSTLPTAKLDVNGTLNVSGVSTFQDNVHLGDNDRLKFGNNEVFEIYSTGTGSIIKETGSGNLKLLGNNILLKNAVDAKIYADFNNGGSVELYYDNSKKFETISTGAKVLGDLAINDTFSINQLTSGRSQIYSENPLEIHLDSEGFYVNTDGIVTFSDALELESRAVFTSSQQELYYNNYKKFETTNTGVTVTGTVDAGGFVVNGTPVLPTKTGEITLGATPAWTGTAGVTVTQQSSGNYRMTFTNPFTNATDYYVFTNHMDYGGGQVVFVKTDRSNTHVDFTVYREGDGAFVDTGSVAVQVIAH